LLSGWKRWLLELMVMVVVWLLKATQNGDDQFFGWDISHQG